MRKIRSPYAVCRGLCKLCKGRVYCIFTPIMVGSTRHVPSGYTTFYLLQDVPSYILKIFSFFFSFFNSSFFQVVSVFFQIIFCLFVQFESFLRLFKCCYVALLFCTTNHPLPGSVFISKKTIACSKVC